MLNQLKLTILDYIKKKGLNYKIVKDENDLFLVDFYYGDEPTFEYSFILNKTTPRWNNCGFIGINEDEFRPMTQDGLNELFEIANECIEYGFCLNVIKENKVIQVYQAVNKSIKKEQNDKAEIITFLKQNKDLFPNDYDNIEYQNFKRDKKFNIKKQ